MKRTPLPVVRDCDSCGACCTGQAALPVHLVGDHFRLDPVTPLPPALADELRAAIARFKAEGWPPDGSPCIWYDAGTKRCRHYEHRPELCREAVKPGDTACLRWRKAAGVDPQVRYRLRNGRLVKEMR